MASYVDMAAGVLSQATRRVEISAQNIANMATPGYKRQQAFSVLLEGQSTPSRVASNPDLTPGKPVQTGAPTDLALLGDGFFAVRSDSGTLYTRSGQFTRAADGRLLSAQGHSLQLQGGGDVIVRGDGFKVLPDGSIVEGDAPLGKLDIVAFRDAPGLTPVADGLFAAGESAVPMDAPATVRQGAYEASNVTGAQEMVEIMAALRQAETGQRLVGVYDDLMGRVIGVLGQGGQ